MCRPVACNVCGKTTWAGCGEHVAQVKAMVPAGEWCGGQHSPEDLAAAPKPKSGLFGIFGH